MTHLSQLRDCVERALGWRAQVAILVLVTAGGCGQPHDHRIESISREERQLPQQPHVAPERLAELRKTWTQMIDETSGGLGSDLPKATTRLENAVKGWGTSSGLNLAKCMLIPNSLPAAGQIPEGNFQQATFDVDATGPLASGARFLHDAEFAAFPIRIVRLQIDPQPGFEDTDKLEFHLTLSTVAIAPGLPGNNLSADAEAATIEYAQHWRAKPRYLPCLADLTTVFPVGTYLTHFVLNDSMAGELIGKSLQRSATIASNLKSQIEGIKRFQAVTLKLLNAQPTDEGQRPAFAITFQYVPDRILEKPLEQKK